MIQVGEKYRHYKSIGWADHTYEIVHIGIFQWEYGYDMQKVVVYKPFYDIPDFPADVSVIVRPVEEFEGHVEYQWVHIPRFTRID